MTFPRIFSLSTVGILKHYVHDYLFHPLRTDFIGPNGVGKSIIADLLQLMFVYDTSLIRFGTDGVKKDERSIYKLPYNLANAYCFLNVEVDNGQFIIIGIAITSQTGSRITPFVISRSAELEKDISDLTLLSDQRLFARDLLNGEQVQDIKALATKLFSDKQLYLTFFRTKEDTKRYYQFLYEKQILSINLSVDEHLSAFAKVIQSFSKAKSLDLSPAKASRSLKQFLFEDADAGLESEFCRQQGQLEKLLRDFSSLETYISELRSKQSKLTELKKKDEHQQQAFKRSSLGEILRLRNIISQSQQAESILKEEMEEEKFRKESTVLLLAEIPESKRLLKKKLDEANSYTQLYIAYVQASEEVERLNNDVTALKVLNPPDITSEWSSIVDTSNIDELSVADIKQLVFQCAPYLKKFDQPSALDKAFNWQKEDVAKWYQSIKSRIADIERLADILSKNSNDSVLGWAMMHSDGLTPAQQAALIYYGTRAVGPSSSPRSGDSYLDPADLTKAADIDASGGFWLQLGALHEFITPAQDEINPFSSADNNKSIQEVIQKLTEEKDVLLLQLQELDSLQRGDVYDRSLISRDYDPFLANYDNVRHIKNSAALIRDLGARIFKLEELYSFAQAKVKQIRSQLPSEIVYDEPEVVERDLKRLANEALDRYTKCCQEETIANKNLQLSESLIQQQIQKFTELTSNILSRQSELATFAKSFYDLYQEIPEENLDAGAYSDVEKLNSLFLEAKQDYQVKYLETVSQFAETNSQKHAAVNHEVSQKSYDFNVLESALLGLKIKHTDEISQELEDANRNRMNMADDIKNTMVLIFNKTVQTYKHYKNVIYTLNQFFQGVKISNRFFFSIDFTKNENIRIEILEDIGSQVRNAAKRGELPFDKPVSNFIEEFFKKTAQLREIVTIDRLLDPKTFFDLSVSLTDEYGEEIPGSTGETYSAIALLGIARLSLVQKERRKGLRFIILEELGSLDTVNFNTFPAIAKEFDYQIITMAPSPFRSNLDDEWYAHHLIKGVSNQNINYHPSASYFKTKDGSQELEAYLKLTS